jgi:hypothetical protein
MNDDQFRLQLYKFYLLSRENRCLIIISKLWDNSSVRA